MHDPNTKQSPWVRRMLPMQTIKIPNSYCLFNDLGQNFTGFPQANGVAWRCYESITYSSMPNTLRPHGVKMDHPIALYLLGYATGLCIGWFAWRSPSLAQMVLRRPDKEKIDAALGLEELPPIRMAASDVAELRAEAARQGLVTQAYVRKVISLRRRLNDKKGA